MNAPLTIRRLQGAATIDYFLRCLQLGGALDAGHNLSALNAGSFSAVVPKGVNAQRVTEFATGGLLRAEPGNGAVAARVQAVPTAVPALSTFLFERIHRFGDPVLWVHEPMLPEEDITIANVRCERLDGQLYLVYEDHFETQDRLAEILRYSNLSWHFLAFLTDQVRHPGSISQLVEQARMIVIGAYDGESFLLWERA